MEFYKNSIEKIREIYSGASPNAEDSFVKPFWVDNFNGINKIYSDQALLFRQGRIVWGALVQANEMIFVKAPFYAGKKDLRRVDLGGNIVFSTDVYFDEHPYELLAIAEKLFSYKDTTNAPHDIKKIVDVISNERETVFNVKLPHSVTDGKEVFFTTAMMVRKHLPQNRLTDSIFPILALPEQLETCILVPKHYWPETFTQKFI